MKTFLDVMNNVQSTKDFSFAPLPAGEWEFRIKAIKTDAELQRDRGDIPQGTPYVAIYLTPTAPIDVDEDALEQCSDWEEKFMSIDLITAGDAAKLMDRANESGLVYDTGLDCTDYDTDEGPDFNQLWKDLLNAKVGGRVTHSVSKKDGKTYANVKKTFPLD